MWNIVFYTKEKNRTIKEKKENTQHRDNTKIFLPPRIRKHPRKHPGMNPLHHHFRYCVTCHNFKKRSICCCDRGLKH